MDRSGLLALFALVTVGLGPACVAGPAAASIGHGRRIHRSRTGAPANRRSPSNSRPSNSRPSNSRSPVNSRNPVSTAAAIAEGYWGATPCGGQVKFIANRPLAAGLDTSTDGWVTFNSASGADNLDAPASSYTNCTISLAHSRWATWTSMEQDWGMFCLTVVHELGHLLGHKHSVVPGSVMAPVFTSDTNVPAVCNQSWLPGWRDSGNH